MFWEFTSPTVAKQFQNTVDISFDGYNDSQRELWEIEAVREYVRALDSEFPYWLFLLSPSSPGFECITLCLTKDVTPPISIRDYGEHLIELFLGR
jgi:hypothetical protein